VGTSKAKTMIAALGGWVRVGPVLALGAGLLWLSFVVSTNTVFGRRAPRLAGLAGWSGAEARASEAQSLLRPDASRAVLARADGLARDALDRELLNARAASVLGSTAALRGDARTAERMFRFSETITRRDLTTQLWLMEAAVQRGDAVGALRHYDRAMSVSIPSWNLLVPVLATAAAEPAIARALAVHLRRRPNWWRAFADQFITTNPDPATAFPIVLPALRLAPRNDIDRPYLMRAAQKLAAVGAYDEAWTLYRQSTGASPAARAGLRNGEFEGENLVAPFDWQLIDGEGLSAVIQSRETGGAGNALYLTADAGRMGDVARQLLLLAPGRYLLSGTSGGTSSQTDRPEVAVTCAGAGTPLLQSPVPPADDGGRRFAVAFDVPAICPAQWLLVRARAPLDTSAPPSWIDALSIRRR